MTLASFFRIAALLVAAWLLLCLGAIVLQRRFQYFPDPGPVVVPDEPRYVEVQSRQLTSADGTKLEAFYWPGTRKTALLHLHGNAGHRGHRLDWMADFHARGWTVLLLDPRGYGGSEGRPTEKGLVDDAEAALDWLHGNGHERVVLYGESLGCGVAGLLAGKRDVAGLVLQAGSISIADVAAKAYPFLPMRRLLQDKYDLTKVAPTIKAPSYSIHGDLDRIIPVELGRKLHDAMGGPKTWWEIEGAGHNDVTEVGGREYVERVHAFLESLE